MATEEQTQYDYYHKLDYAVFRALGQRLTIPNRKVTKLGFWLKREGIGLSGLVYFEINRVSDDGLIVSKYWGQLGDAAPDVPTYEEVTFDTPVVINEEVRIFLRVTGGTADNHLGASGKSSDVKANEVWCRYRVAGLAWETIDTYDFAYRYTYEIGLAPTVTTQAVTDIATSIAIGNGNVTDLGDAPVTQHGHCWNTTGTPTTSDNKTENGAKSAIGAFTSGLSKLTPSTVYRVRAYATSSIGTSYSNEMSFSTTSGASGTGGGVGGVGSVPSATGISFPIGETLLVEERPISKPMPESPMTDIEALVFNWLTRKNIEFQFQTSLMGGFYQLGGAVVDFLLPARNLAWRIFGEYWHRGVQKEGSDVLQKETLAAIGWTVVDLWSSDIQDRLEETLTKALRGEEVLR